MVSFGVLVSYAHARLAGCHPQLDSVLPGTSPHGCAAPCAAFWEVRFHLDPPFFSDDSFCLGEVWWSSVHPRRSEASWWYIRCTCLRILESCSLGMFLYPFWMLLSPAFFCAFFLKLPFSFLLFLWNFSSCLPALLLNFAFNFGIVFQFSVAPSLILSFSWYFW